MDRLIVPATLRARQVAAKKTNIAVHDALQNDFALPCAKLASNVQFCSPAHGGDSTPRFTARCVSLHRCFQDQKIGKAAGVAIAAAKHLFEALRLGRFIHEMFVNRDSESGLEIHSIARQLSACQLSLPARPRVSPLNFGRGAAFEMQQGV